MMKVWTVGAIAFMTLVCTLPAGAETNDDAPPHVVFYQYALYLLPGYEGDPVATATTQVRDKYADYALVDVLDEPPTRPAMLLHLETDVAGQYAVPDMSFIGRFGHGVTREQALAVQKSERALLVSIAYPAELMAAAFPDALALMADLAVQHDSLIWDESTREIFTVDAWREQRIATWNDGNPSVYDHTVIHAYKNTEYVRAITLGMQKFGLPDIVANDFAWSLNRPMGHLINLAAQTLIEGGDFNEDFSLDVDVEKIRNDDIREAIRASLLDKATSRMRLQLKPVEPEEGDPDNFLLEIRFDDAAGNSLQERQEALLSALFGWEDSITEVNHNAAILAASERARARLPELRRAFNQGLEPGEYITVKAPFATADGGTEWMWVEVIEWDGDRIRGLLKNEPVYVPDLKGGAEVTVDQSELFDYIRNFADGRVEGNETGQIMQQAR